MGRAVVLCLLAAGACAQPGDRAPATTATTSTGATGSPVEPPRAAQPTANRVASCIDGTAYDLATMKDRVTYLASAELGGRAPGTPGDVTARAWIAERFACLGLVPAGTDGRFEQPFVQSGASTANVIGYVKGSDPALRDEIIMIGAHHDHMGDGHLGANDNASGVVALLAVAQAVQQRARAPKRTLVFATFGAEEDGMHGSYFYAQHPPADLPIDRMVQFINLDMVGTHASRGFVAAMGTGRGLAATNILATLDDRYPELSVGLGGKARGSDFEPFCKLGVPYVFFWTPDTRCYHKTCDTAERLDYPRMVDIASLAGDLTETLADTDVDLAAARTRLGCFGR